MATSTTDSSQSPPDIPTRIPTFDLSLTTPFIITVVLTLHYRYPITFRKRDTRFFTHPLESPGLEFVNIRTGQTQVGMRLMSGLGIGFDDGDLPAEANREDWMLLSPGQPYTLDASIEPYGGPGGRMRTIAE
jgi:hypothetical protein